MKPPPIPMIPSGLSDDCPDVIGQRLMIRCCNGWGWTHSPGGVPQLFDDPNLVAGEIEVIPEQYVAFTTPRCGIAGRVVHCPPGFQLERFVAFIMSDGCDYDFSDNIAPAWRVMVGDGELDCESEWFPTLRGSRVFSGYGSVGCDSEALDRAGMPMEKPDEADRSR